MINIVLCCHAGTSTSMIEQRIIMEAKKNNIELKVHAHAVTDLAEYINEADIVLFGPQISFRLKEFKTKYPSKIIVAIDPLDYGMMDGKSILNKIFFNFCNNY